MTSQLPLVSEISSLAGLEFLTTPFKRYRLILRNVLSTYCFHACKATEDVGVSCANELPAITQQAHASSNRFTNENRKWLDIVEVITGNHIGSLRQQT